METDEWRENSNKATHVMNEN